MRPSGRDWPALPSVVTRFVGPLPARSTARRPGRISSPGPTFAVTSFVMRHRRSVRRHTFQPLGVNLDPGNALHTGAFHRRADLTVGQKALRLGHRGEMAQHQHRVRGFRESVHRGSGHAPIALDLIPGSRRWPARLGSRGPSAGRRVTPLVMPPPPARAPPPPVRGCGYRTRPTGRSGLDADRPRPRRRGSHEFDLGHRSAVTHQTDCRVDREGAHRRKRLIRVSARTGWR